MLLLARSLKKLKETACVVCPVWVANMYVKKAANMRVLVDIAQLVKFLQDRARLGDFLIKNILTSPMSDMSDNCKEIPSADWLDPRNWTLGRKADSQAFNFGENTFHQPHER